MRAHWVFLFFNHSDINLATWHLYHVHFSIHTDIVYYKNSLAKLGQISFSVLNIGGLLVDLAHFSSDRWKYKGAKAVLVMLVEISKSFEGLGSHLWPDLWTSTVSYQICHKEIICTSRGSDELGVIVEFDSLSSVLLSAVWCCYVLRPSTEAISHLIC